MSTNATGVIPEWTMGDRLRKARSLTGQTTREFADTLGVSQATVTNAENDHRAVRRITLRAWAMATGVPVEWLEHGVTPQGGPDGWAPWGSNPQPTDYVHPLLRAVAA